MGSARGADSGLELCSAGFITSVLALGGRDYYLHSTAEETVSEWESFTQEYLLPFEDLTVPILLKVLSYILP